MVSLPVTVFRYCNKAGILAVIPGSQTCALPSPAFSFEWNFFFGFRSKLLIGQHTPCFSTPCYHTPYHHTPSYHTPCYHTPRRLPGAWQQSLELLAATTPLSHPPPICLTVWQPYSFATTVLTPPRVYHPGVKLSQIPQ